MIWENLSRLFQPRCGRCHWCYIFAIRLTHFSHNVYHCVIYFYSSTVVVSFQLRRELLRVLLHALLRAFSSNQYFYFTGLALQSLQALALPWFGGHAPVSARHPDHPTRRVGCLLPGAGGGGPVAGGLGLPGVDEHCAGAPLGASVKCALLLK